MDKDIVTASGDAPSAAAAGKSREVELLEALEAAERADKIHSKCEECMEYGQAAEVCEKCFPSADDARLKRRAVLAEIKKSNRARKGPAAAVEAPGAEDVTNTQSRPSFASPQELGKVVKAHRDDLGLGIRDAARRIGISHATLCRVENGNPPDFENLQKILHWLSGAAVRHSPISAEAGKAVVELDDYKRGQRDALNAVLSLNPEAAAEVAKWAEKEPDPHGRLPFDVALWVSRVATQLGFEPLEGDGETRFRPVASPTALPATEWQPIETAPKDGTAVLIWDPNTYQGKGGVFIGVYMNTRDYGMQWFCHPSSIRADPTHWQPYPVGPTAPIVASPQPQEDKQ